MKDSSDAQIEAQVLKFHNERVKPQLDIYKKDIKTGALVAGAVYNLIMDDKKRKYKRITLEYCPEIPVRCTNR